MKKLYRYSSSKHNEALLSRGSVRVGTLFDFRKLEHKEGISDPQEGFKKVSHHVSLATGEVAGSVDRQALKAYKAVEFSSDAKGAMVKNCLLVREIAEQDYYIHCTSDSLSKETMASFEGADSCVEIFDPVGFYQRLTNVLMALGHVTEAKFFDVTYKPREEAWNKIDWGMSPALIKEEIYSVQSEFRTIWYPGSTSPLEPIILEDFELTKFCREVDLKSIK